MSRMDPRCQRYIENLRRVRGLARPDLTPDRKSPEVLALIHQNAKTSYALMQENNALLDEVLFSRKASDLTPEEAASLEEFAAALFQYANSEDCGIAYRVRRLLLEHARLQGDDAVILRQLYHCGITLHYLNIRADEYGIDPFGAQVQAYFREGAEYIAHYEEFDRESRSYIMRCVGNCRMAMPRLTRSQCRAYLEVSDWGMNLLCSPHYRELNPDLPWDNFEYSMHMDRMTLLAYLRTHDDPKVAREVLCSAEYVYQKKVPGQGRDERIQHWRIGYSYAAARFHAGVGPARDVVDELLYVAENTDADDYSPTAINNKLLSTAYLFPYEQRMPPAERARYAKRIEAAETGSVEYLNRLPANQYPRVASAAVRELVEMQAVADKPYRRDLLLYLLAAHKPTYVHSLMVANITRLLVRQLVEKDPAALVGALGCKSIAEVQQRKESLCLEAYEAGLYHDVGKSVTTMYIGVNARRLLDEEFTCIQLHAAFGFQLLCKTGHKDDFALAALYHHCYCDGSGGYPQGLPPCPAHYKALVDALTVADSLDAATDDVGRCYTAAKPLSVLLGELRAQSGTRYAPAVVRLFDDPAFCADFEQELYAMRQSVYLDVYQEKL